LHSIYGGAGGPARVGPGPAHFAVDQPIVEGVADPRSERNASSLFIRKLKDPAASLSRYPHCRWRR
jgi:hypothetical protein